MMHGFGFGYGYGGPMSWLFGLLGLIMNLSFVIIAVLAAIWLFRSVFKKEDTPELSHTSALGNSERALCKRRTEQRRICKNEGRNF
jgi:flagellar biogenesis protein FliO